MAGAVSRGEIERGILICSTGIGMSIIANRFKGVRASLCTSTYLGKMTRAHNNSNLLCLGGRITGYLEALDILETWLATPYDGGRHDISLGLIAEAERNALQSRRLDAGRTNEVARARDRPDDFRSRARTSVEWVNWLTGDPSPTSTPRRPRSTP